MNLPSNHVSHPFPDLSKTLEVYFLKNIKQWFSAQGTYGTAEKSRHSSENKASGEGAQAQAGTQGHYPTPSLSPPTRVSSVLASRPST